MIKKIFQTVVLIFLFYGCAQVISPQKNEAPQARFSISQKEGNTRTEFIFDGSFSSDDQDSVQNLNYFWRYFSRYGRRIDSSYAMIDTATFQDTGQHIIELTVYDSDSLSSSVSDTIQIRAYTAPAISTIDSCFKFGPVEIGFKVTKKLPVTNIGTDTLMIDAIYFTGEGKSAYTCDFESRLAIPPDSMHKIRVNFMPDDTGDFDAAINFNSDDPEVPLKKVCMRGQGFEDLYDIEIVNLDTDTLGFGRVKLDSDSSFSLSLRNKGNQSREIMAAYVVGEGRDAFSCGFSSEFIIEPGSARELDITFSPRDTIGYTAKLVIKSDDQFSKKKEIYLKGKGFQNVPVLAFSNLDKDTLDFGEVEAGLGKSGNIEIMNEGNAELNITAMYITDPDKRYFSTDFYEEFSLDPGASNTIKIRFEPDSNLVYIARLIVQSNDPYSGKKEIFLKGTGIKSQLEVSEPADRVLAFGPVRVGQDSTQKVMIKNTGARTQKIIAAYFTGANKKDFLSDFESEISIEPGDEKGIAISFIPADTISYDVDFIIRTDETFSSKKVISITGEGYKKEPYLEIIRPENDSLNYGYVEINSDSTRELEIGNRGESVLEILAVYFTGPGKDYFKSDFLSEMAIKPDQSTTITVTFNPLSNAKIQETYCNILSNDPDSALYTIPLAGEGTFPPQVQTKDTLSFGEINLSDNASKNLQIKNIGQGPILNLKFKLSAPDFDYQYSQQIDLMPGSSINVPVFFNPVSAGQKNAELILNSANHGDFKRIYLQGTAVSD
jgi:uncharacterized cupredoxin-like copper-binding protein